MVVKRRVVPKNKIIPKKKVIPKKKIITKKRIIAKKKIIPKKNIILKKRIVPKKKIIFKKNNISYKKNTESNKPLINRNISNININKLSDLRIESNNRNGDIFVVIFTYDRYQKLCHLLDDINKNKKNYNILVNIFDDASKGKQLFLDNKYDFPINYYKFKHNHGKRKWYKMHEYIMSKIRMTNFNYYIYLADDMRLVDNFFEKSIYNFNIIKDNSKICLNLNNDRGIINQWTKIRPKKYNSNVWETGWVDMCFISKHILFRRLYYRFINFKEQTNPKLSSGVGRYMSMYLSKHRYKLYQVVKSLVIHDGNNDSKMNRNIRRKNKLISKT